MAKKIRITWEKVRVHRSESYGLFGEPGSSAEWFLVLQVHVVSTDEVLRPIAEGLGALDVDVLLALGSAPGTTLGPLPPNVRVEAFVDQPAVLRHADLAVHTVAAARSSARSYTARLRSSFRRAPTSSGTPT
jgi:hypothetical protein